MEGEQKGFPATADLNRLVQQGKEVRAGCPFGQVRHTFPILAGQLTDPPVHVRPVRLQKIVRQTERISAVAMVNAKRRNQARRDDGASDCRADYRITVVQQRVYSLGSTLAAECRSKQPWPIPLRGLCLQVFWVAGAYTPSHRRKTAVIPGEVGQHGRLLKDLGPHDRLPCPFAYRQAGLDLGAVPFGLDMVRIEGKHHSGGLVIAAR